MAAITPVVTRIMITAFAPLRPFPANDDSLLTWTKWRCN